MSKKNQHVVPNSGGWAVKGAGNDKNTRNVKTQADAIEIAKQIAKNQQSELLIHSKNGQINRRNSYGNDPESSKG